MKHLIYIIGLLALFTLQATAKDTYKLKAQADSAYAHERYEQAARLYTEVARTVESPQVCYNLGCTYYRLDDMARSVLWLERAYLLNPGDDDIRFNLELARSKTIDKITPRHEIIFVSLYRRLVNMMSLQAWTVTCITLFVLSLLAFALFFFSDRMSLRKTGFFAAILFFVLTLLGNVCALQLRSYNRNRTGGIILSPAVTVKSTPSESGNDLFVLHEGTRIEMLDSTLKDWCEVEIADGKVGWVRKNTFEVI